MSRKLGSLPIDALNSFPTEAVFNQPWNARCTELDKLTRRREDAKGNAKRMVVDLTLKTQFDLVIKTG
jgi:hypothetical protein